MIDGVECCSTSTLSTTLRECMINNTDTWRKKSMETNFKTLKNSMKAKEMKSLARNVSRKNKMQHRNKNCKNKIRIEMSMRLNEAGLVLLCLQGMPLILLKGLKQKQVILATGLRRVKVDKDWEKLWRVWKEQENRRRLTNACKLSNLIYDYVYYLKCIESKKQNL